MNTKVRNLAARFERDWKMGAAPDIRAYVAECQPSDDQQSRRELLLKLIAIDLTCRWRRAWFELCSAVQPTAVGAPKAREDVGIPDCPLVEDYLYRWPELNDARTAPVGLLAAEYTARHQWGDNPESTEFEKRFPGNASRICHALQQCDAVRSALRKDKRIELRVTDESGATRTLTHRATKTILVGRAPDADLVLAEDQGVSKYHCRIEWYPPDCYVQDLGSRSGTWLNGQRIREAFPDDGDTLTVGTTKIVIRIAPVSPTQTAARSPDSETAFPETVPPLSDDIKSPSSSLRLIDRTLSGFTIVRELGRGGMGVVFEAVRKGTGETVALKLITPAAEQRSETIRLFLREATVLSQLRHKRIVEFQEVGMADDQLFIAMEYVNTIDLRAHLAGRNQADQDGYCCGVVCQLLEGLAYAHDCGVVHRDIKPSNTLVCLVGNRLRTKLTDFGLAKICENAGFSGITKSGEIRGTVAFMAPEQLADARYAKPAADIYAVGATLYYYLTGQYPFDTTTSTFSLKTLLQAPPVPIKARRPDLPTGLAEAIEKAMDKEPARRYRTAREMYRALLPFVRKRGEHEK